MAVPHVLIIGAGVTGLIVAHGLKKASIPFTVFEAEPSADHYRPREWTMGIHWALPQLEALLPEDLVKRFKEAQTDPFLDDPAANTMRIWSGTGDDCMGKEGRILKQIPIPRTLRVSRRKIRKLCCDGIDVEYGHSLSDITYSSDNTSVTASFTNGNTVAGSIIVGTDGPKSSVRHCLLGAAGDITPMEIIHANVAVSYNDASKALFVRTSHPVFSVAVSPTNTLSFLATQDVPSPDDPAHWRFQVVTSWLGDPSRAAHMTNAQRLAEVKERGSKLCDPFRSAILWMPDDTPITYDTMAYWVCTDFDTHAGRTTLAGDAAHPMTPHRGQGLNHAICDASNFVAAMQKVIKGEAEQDVVMEEYSKEVVKRGREEVLISKMNGEMMLDWKTLMDSPMMSRGLERNG